MNDQTPKIVIDIIKLYEEARRIENENKERERQRQTEEINAKGKAIVDQWIQKAFADIPDWLRQYYSPEETSLNYDRIVHGWDKEDELTLTFKIPGLARIQLRDGEWRSESCGWSRGYEDSEPYIHFGRDTYWRKSLDATLAVAKSVMEEHQRNLIQYEAEQARFAKRVEEDEQFEKAANQMLQKEREARQAAKHDEEQALLQALKNDPIAIHMLKAFVLLCDERSAFEQRLEEMDADMYSMEDRWSRKAADLRRQADDAERRARDEQSRLQSDLDDAEAELKKAKRGW